MDIPILFSFTYAVVLFVLYMGNFHLNPLPIMYKSLLVSLALLGSFVLVYSLVGNLYLK